VAKLGLNFQKEEVMDVLFAVFFVAVLMLNAASFFGSSPSSSEEIYNKSVLDTNFNRNLNKNA